MSISFPQIYLYSEKDPVVPSVRLGGINVLQAQGTHTKLFNEPVKFCLSS